jgi:hypothetical protein
VTDPEARPQASDLMPQVRSAIGAALFLRPEA